MIKDVIIALAFFAVLGGVLGFLLALVDKKMAVRTDPKIGEVADLLPGANCGGCGYAGCAALAEAVVKDGVSPTKCAGLKRESLDKIAGIIGVEAPVNVVKLRAVVRCHGDFGNAQRKFKYTGISDCHAAAKLHGGSKLCPDGCIGHGSCVTACKFGALSVVNGVAVVNSDKCVGCGACVVSCPKGLIELIPADSHCYIACRAREKGTAVKAFCQLGCIGCGICVRGCEESAIVKEGNLVYIQQDKCISCDACVSKCPRGIITRV